MMCNACDNVTLTRLDALACQWSGLQPDSRGYFRWCGVAWRGFPWPKRVAYLARIRLRGYRFGWRDAMKQFGGCGCIDVLKRGVERLRTAAARVWRAARPAPGWRVKSDEVSRSGGTLPPPPG
ncbi:MAG: hypothetical protein JSS51_10200 [Planctomycetes bacterium]|nr:hypothetical protein [Planctomycetota bacterium]